MLATLVAFALAAPAAPEEKPKELTEAAKKDLKALEGVWKAVKAVTDGNEETPKMGDQDVVLEFKGRKLLVNEKEIMEIAAIDPATDPKCIDLKALADMGGIRKDTVYEAIYKLEKDTLTLALHVEGGSNRPSKFESAAGSKVVVVTLERQKK
jgi:uncharacterized protein (TIGR03067 family)